MILVGFFILCFRKILIYFFSLLCIKVTWVLLLFLKVHLFVYPKQFLLFLEKLGSDPSLGPIRALTHAKIIFKWIKIISTVIAQHYCQKKFDMKITSSWVIDPQSSIKIAFCSVFNLSLLKTPLWSHVFFVLFLKLLQ